MYTDIPVRKMLVGWIYPSHFGEGWIHPIHFIQISQDRIYSSLCLKGMAQATAKVTAEATAEVMAKVTTKETA
jgi:hypothetical protein